MFADDSATIADQEEHASAKEQWESTLRDFDERLNAGKTEELVLVPGEGRSMKLGAN